MCMPTAANRLPTLYRRFVALQAYASHFVMYLQTSDAEDAIVESLGNYTEPQSNDTVTMMWDIQQVEVSMSP